MTNQKTDRRADRQKTRIMALSGGERISTISQAVSIQYVHSQRQTDVKQLGSRPGGRCDMQPFQMITDNITKARHFSLLGDMCRMGR